MSNVNELAEKIVKSRINEIEEKVKEQILDEIGAIRHTWLDMYLMLKNNTYSVEAQDNIDLKGFDVSELKLEAVWIYGGDLKAEFSLPTGLSYIIVLKPTKYPRDMNKEEWVKYNAVRKEIELELYPKVIEILKKRLEEKDREISDLEDRINELEEKLRRKED